MLYKYAVCCPCFVFLKIVCFQMLASIRDCFVTGKWDEDKDARTLLKEDGKKTKCTRHHQQLIILAAV